MKDSPVREPISTVNGGADKAAAKDPVATESTPPTEEMKSDVSDIHHYAQAVSKANQQLTMLCPSMASEPKSPLTTLHETRVSREQLSAVEIPVGGY